MKRLYCLIFATTLFCATTTWANATLIQKSPNGKFTADLQNAQLSEVVKYFEKNYGLVIHGNPAALQGEVTVSLTNVNLEKLLKKVLTHENYVLTYDKRGEVVGLHLFDSGANAGATADTGITSLADDTPPVDGDDKFNDIFNADGTTVRGVYPNSYAFNASENISSKPKPKHEPMDLAVDPNEKDEITSFKVEKDDPSDPITSFKIDQVTKNDPIVSSKPQPDSPPSLPENKQ